MLVEIEADAIVELQSTADPQAMAASTSATIEAALAMRPGDADLEEIRDLFTTFSARWRRRWPRRMRDQTARRERADRVSTAPPRPAGRQPEPG